VTVRRLVLVVLAAAVVAAGCAGKNDPTQPPVAARIEYAPGLQLDLYRPIRGFAPLPTVVLVHGGGFTDGSRADMASLAEALAYRGYASASIDYRLSQGSWFPAQELTDPGLAAAADLARQDTAAAIDFLRAHAGTYRLDPARLAVAGYSAGGITALEVATHPPPMVWAAIAVAGAAIDQAALAAPHPPMLLVHGDLDDVIPESLAETTCQAAAASGGCEVQTVAEVGHGIMTSVKFPDVVADIDTFLKGLQAG
jgi:acetyl esterase/lipase